MSNDLTEDAVPVLAVGIATVLVVLGLAWAIQGNEFFLAKTFAPRMEQVRRETFEESKAYNEGVAQELRRMQSEYIRATPEQRAALASVILHQTAGYDSDRLPTDLRRFLEDLKESQ